MAPTEDPGYGHALGSLLGDIHLSDVDLDSTGRVTEKGREWLEELLNTFGYNPAMLKVLKPEYIELAKQIIEAHSGESVVPGQYEGISAEKLLNDLPGYIISPHRTDDTA